MSSQTMDPAGGDLWARRACYLLTWPNFDTAIQSIVTQVRSARENPDCVLGISRGGLVPAVALSNVMGISALHAIAVERNIGAGQYLDKQPPRVLWHGNPNALRRRRVLVVDDVAGSGTTLRRVREEVLLAEAASVRTAVIVRMQRGTSTADFVAVELDDWVVFPWEDLKFPEGTRTRQVVIPEPRRPEDS